MPTMKCQPRQPIAGLEGMFGGLAAAAQRSSAQHSKLWEHASLPHGEECVQKMTVTKTDSQSDQAFCL